MLAKPHMSAIYSSKLEKYYYDLLVKRHHNKYIVPK
jgi:hypothetical protein